MENTLSKLVDQLVNKETGLDEREEYFLDVLFTKAKGDFELAMDLAGYPKSSSVSQLRKKLSKHIRDYTKDYIVSQTAKAAQQLVNVFQDPNALGTKNILTAAKEILDRGDVNKEEQKFEIPENIISVSYTHLTLPTNREV